VIPSDIAEEGRAGESPEALVRRLALEKAGHIAARAPESWVLGADTIVVIGSARLGKPATPDDARKMILRLSGKRHRVLTGIALVCRTRQVEWSDCEETGVCFKVLDRDEIERYIRTPEPYDKAGGYGIQGGAARFIERIEGDRSNVVGLPVDRVRQMLVRAGLL